MSYSLSQGESIEMEQTEMTHGVRSELWKSWVWANAWAELLGLGATFVLGYGIFVYLPEPNSPVSVLVFVLAMTATGVVEGSVVGWFQWRVIRTKFRNIQFRDWWRATLIGALVAWFLGSLPSSLMSMSSDAAAAAPVEPALGLVLLLACGMGLILGVVLALPQWWVLRGSAVRAWTWLPANSAAWGLGMPLIFVGIDVAQRTQNVVALALLAFTLFATGAVVGVVHGSFLIRLELAQSPTNGTS